MKRWLILAAIAVATTAYAGGQDGNRTQVGVRGSSLNVDQVVGGVVDADSTTKAFRVDASGNLQTKDAGTTAAALTSIALLSNNALSSTGTDSMTAAADIRGYRRVYLTLQGWVDSATTVARILVQVRGHTSSAVDTSSTFKFNFWRRISTAALSATGATDSVGDILTATSATVPDNGEFVWVIAGRPTATGNDFGTKNIMIPLAVPESGAGLLPPFISVRVRAWTNGTATIKSRVKIRVGLVGSVY